MLAKPIQNLISAFTRLPGVGPKTAERFVIFLLKSGRGEVTRLEKSLEELLQTIKSCEICHNFSDNSPCEICTSSLRDKTIVCVVAEPQDVMAIEKTKSFSGVYHVLRGLIDPLEDGVPGYIKINELLARTDEKNPIKISEIIFALDPTIEGETTVQYISKKIATDRPHVSLSRLATGIPSGGSVEYADEVTLASAIKTRQKI
ncbi:MAG: recombination mediator RecR [Candidatus Magasanikbacteria bacterium]|nr:recombination mediator RecR [Candidatus Magasanikbacteria bacterium]